LYRSTPNNGRISSLVLGTYSCGRKKCVTALDADTALIPISDVWPRSERRVLIDVDGDLNREFAQYRGRFMLLRPDKFVAATWRPIESPDVCAQVLTWTPQRVTTNAAR